MLHSMWIQGQADLNPLSLDHRTSRPSETANASLSNGLSR